MQPRDDDETFCACCGHLQEWHVNYGRLNATPSREMYLDMYSQITHLSKEIDVLETKLSDARSATVQLQANAIENYNKCAVCFDAVPNTVMLPCRHANLCTVCSDQVMARDARCPTCRAPVRKRVRYINAASI